MRNFIRHYSLRIKSVSITLFCLVVINYGDAQVIEGVYTNETDTIIISGGSIFYSIATRGGFEKQLFGQGNFESVGCYLVVRLSTFDGIKSTIEQECNGSFALEITDENGSNLEYVSIIFTDSVGEKLGTHYSTADGSLRDSIPVGTTEIEVNVLGFDALKFTYLDNCAFKVKLVPGEIFEDGLVVFKIENSDSNTLDLKYLHRVGEKGKVNRRQIKKLEKKQLNNSIAVARTFRKKNQ